MDKIFKVRLGLTDSLENIARGKDGRYLETDFGLIYVSENDLPYILRNYDVRKIERGGVLFKNINDENDCEDDEENITDELFERIEYEKVKVDEKSIIYEKYLNGYANRAQIYFDKTHHTVCCAELDEDFECDSPLDLTVEEIQVITRKLKELGWN